MEYENDILIEDDIMRFIYFNGGISGTTSVLVYEADLSGKISLKKINFKISTIPWETHEVCWREYFVQVKNHKMSVTQKLFIRLSFEIMKTMTYLLVLFPHLSHSSQNCG